MQINGPSHIHGPQSVQGPHRTNQAASPPASQPAHGTDQVDISPEAQLLSQLREIPDIRADRVAEVRQAIESGAYETPEKLDIALDRLLDELA